MPVCLYVFTVCVCKCADLTPIAWCRFRAFVNHGRNPPHPSWRIFEKYSSVTPRSLHTGKQWEGDGGYLGRKQDTWRKRYRTSPRGERGVLWLYDSHAPAWCKPFVRSFQHLLPLGNDKHNFVFTWTYSTVQARWQLSIEPRPLKHLFGRRRDVSKQALFVTLMAWWRWELSFIGKSDLVLGNRQNKNTHMYVLFSLKLLCFWAVHDFVLFCLPWVTLRRRT